MKARLPSVVRAFAPYMLLPAIVLATLLIIFAPHVWGTLHHTYAVCRLYLEKVSAGMVLITTVGAVAALGVLAGLAAAARELLRLRKLSQSLTNVRCSHYPGPDDLPMTLVEDNAPYAFCHGLRYPRVYLSTGLVRALTALELRAVLLHETAHARRRDPRRVFQARVLAAVFFPLPISGLVRDRFLAKLEVGADREAVREAGIAPLAGALVKLLQDTPPAAAAAASGIHPTKARIEFLLDPGANPAIPLIPRRALLVTGALLSMTALLATLGVNFANGMLAWASLCRVPLS